MVERSQSLDAVFHALADPTRRAMVQALIGGERHIGALAAPFAMSFAAAAKHVKVLENAGLVRREVRGRIHVCHLETAALRAAEQWITARRAGWERRLDRLGTLLDSLDGAAEQNPEQKQKKE